MAKAPHSDQHVTTGQHSDQHTVPPGQHSDQHNISPSSVQRAAPVRQAIPVRQAAIAIGPVPSLEDRQEAARLRELEIERKRALASKATVGKI